MTDTARHRSSFSVLNSARSALWILALMLVLPFLSFYPLAIVSLLIQSTTAEPSANAGAITMLMIIPDMLFFVTAGIFFANASIYLATSVICLVGAVVKLLNQSASQRSRVIAFVVMACVVGFPFVFHYQAPLGAASGYVLRNATEPMFPENVVKAAQSVTEQVPCHYELLGWQASKLFYRADCGNTQQWMEYDIANNTNHSMPSTPKELTHMVVAKSRFIDSLSASGVYPASAEWSTRQLHVSGDGLLSADQTHIAFISKRGYGPLDVLILSRQSGESFSNP